MNISHGGLEALPILFVLLGRTDTGIRKRENGVRTLAFDVSAHLAHLASGKMSAKVGGAYGGATVGAS